MEQHAHGTVKKYSLGFGLSLLFTLAAYFLVSRHVESAQAISQQTPLIIAIFILAIAQLIVQVVFFLHVGKESGPKWNLMAFSFMLVVVFILVGGSMWIMGNLHYNMMSPHDMNEYMLEKANAGF